MLTPDQRKKGKDRLQAMEQDRLGRLAVLKGSIASCKEPRWMMVNGTWIWHEWSVNGWVNTGLEAVPGRPIALQRPQGR